MAVHSSRSGGFEGHSGEEDHSEHHQAEADESFMSRIRRRDTGLFGRPVRGRPVPGGLFRGGHGQVDIARIICSGKIYRLSLNTHKLITQTDTCKSIMLIKTKKIQSFGRF